MSITANVRGFLYTFSAESKDLWERHYHNGKGKGRYDFRPAARV